MYRKRKALSFALSLCLLLTTFTLSGFALELEQTAPVGDQQEGVVTAHKTAEYDPSSNLATITLTVQGSPVQQTQEINTDIVVVVDASGSMGDVNVGVCGGVDFSEVTGPLGHIFGYRCSKCGKFYSVYEWSEDMTCTNLATRMDITKDAAYTLAETVLQENSGNRLAVISFGSSVKDSCDFQTATTSGIETVYDTLRGIKASGGTDYTVALEKAQDFIENRDPEEADRPTYVIFLSDGAPGPKGDSHNDPKYNGIEQATSLKGAGTTIYTIGISLDSAKEKDLQALRSLASEKENNPLFENVPADDFQGKLKALLKQIGEYIISIPAGTSAVLTDFINSDAFDIITYSAIESITQDEDAVIWQVGEITEAGKTATIVVAPKNGVSGSQYTNDDVRLTYTDYTGGPVEKTKDEIGHPAIQIPGTTRSSITVNYVINGTGAAFTGGGITYAETKVQGDDGSMPVFTQPQVIMTEGYVLSPWAVDGNPSSAGIEIPQDFVEQDLTDYALFDDTHGTVTLTAITSSGSIEKEFYTITSSNDGNGSAQWTEMIEDQVKTFTSGAALVEAGGQKTYTIVPNSNYRLNQIVVDGQAVSATGTGSDGYSYYTFDNVATNHAIHVTFDKIGSSNHSSRNKSKGGTEVTAPALNKGDHYAYIAGYEDGTVQPQSNISREEVAAIYFRLLSDDSRKAYLKSHNTFTDLTEKRWSNVSVSTMENAGILHGYPDQTFRPGEFISRAEFAAIAAQFDSDRYDGENAFSDIDGHWAEEFINRAVDKGWIQGYPDQTFRPDQPITRAEAMTLINRVLDRQVADKKDLLEDMITWPDNADTSEWYYFDVQEATNGHYYEREKGKSNEHWTSIRPSRDWKSLER